MDKAGRILILAMVGGTCACSSSVDFGGAAKKGADRPVLQGMKQQDPGPPAEAAGPMPAATPAVASATPSPAPAAPASGSGDGPASSASGDTAAASGSGEAVVPAVFSILDPGPLAIVQGSSSLPDVGETLTHEFTTKDGTGAVTFSMEVTPALAGATLTGGKVEIAVGPAAADDHARKTYTLKLTAHDGAGNEARRDVTVVVAPLEIELVNTFTAAETITAITILEPFHPDRRYVMNEKYGDELLAKVSCDNLEAGGASTTMPENAAPLPDDIASVVDGRTKHLFTSRIAKQAGAPFPHYIVYTWVHFTAAAPAKPVRALVETCVSNAAQAETGAECRVRARADHGGHNLFYCADYLNGNAAAGRQSFYDSLWQSFFGM